MTTCFLVTLAAPFTNTDMILRLATSKRPINAANAAFG